MASRKPDERINSLFFRLAQSDRKIHNAYLLVDAPRHDLRLSLAAGDPASGIEAHPDQPVFMASVGKLFTAAIIGRLVDQGRLRFDDPIATCLDPGLLRGMHHYKGVDYSGQIKVRHLLNHTSGLPDYFEDKPAQGKGVLWHLINQPERRWSPHEIVEWSNHNLRPRFAPGRGFHYSDTGYHLLGLLIEAVTGLPFHEVLRTEIFQPLEMRQAYLLGHSQPAEPSPHPVAGLYYGHQNIIHYPSLSVDYAGGGVTAPLADLLKFLRALAHGRLLQPATLAAMLADTARFSLGIDYGYGLMKIVTVPVIFPARFNCWGNAGSTGAFLFYHPGLDTGVIGSLNQFGYPAQGIRFMLRVIDSLSK